MHRILMLVAIAAGLLMASLSVHATGDTVIGGKMYFDMSHLSQKLNGVPTSKDGSGLDVKRFYFSVTHRFDDIWSVNLTTDFNYVSSDQQTNLFVKKAYLQGYFSKMAVLRVGTTDMPWIPFAEHMYGYRFVENTIIDRLHYGNSADWGVHMLGKGDNDIFNYQVSLVNGGGYKHPNRTRGMDFAGRVGFQPIQGLMLALGVYSGKLGKDTQTAPARHTTQRYDALLAYHNSRFRIGGEYFNARNWNNINTIATDRADGYSVYGNINLHRGMAVFARYDKTNLSKTIDPSLQDTYYNAGVSQVLTKGLILALVYKHDNRQSNTSQLKSDEIGVWGQVKF